MEKLYKTGLSPQQVQADLGEQSRSRADLKRKARPFPARLGREAGKSNARVQRCRMPVLALTCRLPGLFTGSRLLPLSLRQPLRAGGDKQELGAPGAAVLPAPAAEESSIKQVLGCQVPSTLGSAAHPSTALLCLLSSLASPRLQRKKEQLLLPNPGVTAAREGWSQFLPISQPQGAAPARGEHLLPAALTPGATRAMKETPA